MIVSNNYNKGLTFIEVIIASVILGFLAMSIFFVFTAGTRIYQTETSLINLQENVRLGIDSLLRELRRARLSTVSISGNGSRVDFYPYSSTNTVAYYLQEGNLIREHPQGVKKTVVTGINSLTFSLSGSVITITLSAQENRMGRTYSFSLKQKARIRNE